MNSITNGYDPEQFEPNPIPPMSGSTIEIVHTGQIYAGRSPIALLDAIQTLDAAALAGKSLRVRFIGGFQFEKQRQETEERIRGKLDGSVFLEGQLPYNQSIRAVTEADILLLLDTPGRRAGVPAKLYEYIGAGRPVLALAERESDVAWALKESGLPHRIAAPLDIESIRRELLELMHAPASVRYGGHAGRAQSPFTRERVAGDLAAVLDSCAKRPPPRVGSRSLHEVAP
jgi:hypothetical protein